MAKHEHTFTVQMAWLGNLGEGTKSYTAYARDHVISAPGKPAIPGSSDPAFRGDGTRYNPEELFVASFSTCHMLWYLHLCATNQVTVREYADEASAVLRLNPDGGGAFESVRLSPRVVITEESDPEKALALHEEAHRLCFIANSAKVRVEITPDVRVA